MITAVLLAAGTARRFDGRQKLLARVPHAGTTVPLVRLSVIGLMEAKLERIVVVVGRDADSVRQSVQDLGVTVVANAAYAAGMSGSLRVGVEEAARRWPDSEALLVALGDQPVIGRGIVERLVRELEQVSGGADRQQIVAPRFEGVFGTPVLFARALIPELLAVTGDRGARAVVECEPARVRYVDFAEPAPPDVDTASDLASLTRVLRSAGSLRS
jgi:molybdenum cofactor cytidylyltransferase